MGAHLDRFIAFLFALLLIAPANAATITADSGSQADVATALALAAANDTVEIPFGTNFWTSNTSWVAPFGVTVRGAGSANGGPQTVIIANHPDQTAMLTITATNSGLRITGIAFQSSTNAVNYKYVLSIYGGQNRIDRNRFSFTNLNYRIAFYDGAFGVVYSNQFQFRGGGSSIWVNNGRRGINDGAGNLEWNLPTEFGGTNYLFIEDNDFSGSPTFDTHDSRVFDAYTGAKVVGRFNNLTNVNSGETHSTGHAGDDRGLRSQEIYRNTNYHGVYTAGVDPDGVYPGFGFGTLYSGTSLIWQNSYGQCHKNFLAIQVVRRNGLSGGGTYDQAATPTGWGYAGTNFNGTGSAWDGNVNVGTGYPVLDQPGRGYGDLLSNAFPNKVRFTTGTISWPTQALEPIYIWANTGSLVAGWGGSTYSDSSDGRVQANRDYYQQASGIQTSPTSPFDGTSGTGWGTLANRPTTCTAGVAYWATDQGDWNTRGEDGALYVATATDTWTLYYEPQTYPHTLREEGGSPPPEDQGASSGLRINNLHVGTLRLQ
jgi:hypothetical protein